MYRKEKEGKEEVSVGSRMEAGNKSVEEWGKFNKAVYEGMGKVKNGMVWLKRKTRVGTK